MVADSVAEDSVAVSAAAVADSAEDMVVGSVAGVVVRDLHRCLRPGQLRGPLPGQPRGPLQDPRLGQRQDPRLERQ